MILDLTGGVIAAVQRERGVTVEPFTEWHIDNVLKPILGEPWMKWMRRKDWLWATFPVIEGAIGALEDLHRAGHYVECITSKPEWARHSVWKWLSLWRPYFDRVTIVGMDDSKADFTDADILIDDKPKNCEEFVANLDGRVAILFERSHNRLTPTASPAIFRADGWDAVLAVIQVFAAQEEK